MIGRLPLLGTAAMIALVAATIASAAILPGCAEDSPRNDVAFVTTGFRAERVVTTPDEVRAMAIAPDGRLFVAEWKTGRIRVVRTDDQLQPTPFATLRVDVANRNGLLDIALSPTFDMDGLVYVLATVPDPLRMQVVRLQDNGLGQGVNPTVIVDNLPASDLRVGAALQIQDDPMVAGDEAMLVALGDMGNPSTTGLNGTVLRYTLTGGIPADNPSSSSPVWADGLREPVSMTQYSSGASVFLAERGAIGDRLFYVQRESHFDWPEPSDMPGTSDGRVVHEFGSTIGIADMTFHDGMFGATQLSEYAGNLFVVGENDRAVRRILLRGALNTTFVANEPFVTFGAGNEPRSILRDPRDGALIVSTVKAIFRIAPTNISTP